MASHNVDVMREAAEAFNNRDLDAMIALADPNVAWHSTFAAVGGDVYHGHDGVRRWHRDLEDAWGQEIRVEGEAVFAVGEQLLWFAVLHARGRQSGVEVAMPIAQVWKFRDGLVAYCNTYTDREVALRELGVSVEALEPVGS